MKQIALDISLQPGPSLQNYLPGDNGQALQHLKLWLESSRRAPVPTYLWGPSGSGKSHLLRAVANALQAQGQSFGWIDADCTEPGPFVPEWRAVLFDDVHRYSIVQQHAAFNWFVHASAPGREPCWILAARDSPPADLAVRDDLRSRLGWGHVFALQALSDAQRRAVLLQQAQARGLTLSSDVVDYMLTRFSRDLGHQSALLDQLDAYALQTQRAITVPLLKSMLDDLS